MRQAASSPLIKRESVFVEFFSGKPALTDLDRRKNKRAVQPIETIRNLPMVFRFSASNLSQTNLRLSLNGGLRFFIMELVKEGKA
nr:hypothetical protein [Bacillaceae bacterium]